MIGTIHKLVRTSRSLRQRTGRAPGVEELAVRLNLPPRAVAEALRIAKGLVAMERPFGELDDEETDQEAPEAAGDAAGQPDALTAREERVLCMRFDIALETDPALEALGRQLLESRKRLRDIEGRARRTLKPKDDEAS
jgi:DNA-directed RNA polymerase sigma subunit (sigma70/sigma32)